MARDRRRVWLYVGLCVVAVLSATLAWWFTPAPEAPASDDEAWSFPPVEGVEPPPMPPPGSDTDTDGSVDALDGDGSELTRALGAWLDTDAAALGDDASDAADPEGWRVQRWAEPWRGAGPPGTVAITAMVVTDAGDVLAQAQRQDGSVILLSSADDPGPPRVLQLDGVSEVAVVGARARAPALTTLGPVVVAEDAGGRSRVWTVDLEDGVATPTPRDGLDRGGAVAADLERLAASGSVVAAVWRDAGVAVRRVDGAEGWVIFDEGPAGIGAVDVRALGGGAELAYTRSGRLLRLSPDRTVADTVVRDGASDPVFVSGELFWVRRGRVASTVGFDEALRPLPGRDLVRGSRGESAAWVGRDGRVRLLPDLSVVDAGLDRITAVAVARRGSTTTVAVAGRRGAVAELVVLER